MERHSKQIHVRMSEAEIGRAKRLAADAGMTLSNLIRVLLQLPSSSIEEGCRLVVIDRALASDYINIDVPEGIREFDWAEAMDATRRSFGNDLPWRGKRARTYKHYVVSPEPQGRHLPRCPARSRDLMGAGALLRIRGGNRLPR